MPLPPNERQRLEHELAEIPGQIAAYWRELDNGTRRAQRERLEWHIREREKRLAEIKARLAAIRAETR